MSRTYSPFMGDFSNYGANPGYTWFDYVQDQNSSAAAGPVPASIFNPAQFQPYGYLSNYGDSDPTSPTQSSAEVGSPANAVAQAVATGLATVAGVVGPPGMGAVTGMNSVVGPTNSNTTGIGMQSQQSVVGHPTPTAHETAMMAAVAQAVADAGKDANPSNPAGPTVAGVGPNGPSSSTQGPSSGVGSTGGVGEAAAGPGPAGTTGEGVSDAGVGTDAGAWKRGGHLRMASGGSVSIEDVMQWLGLPPVGGYMRGAR